ncbi:4-hydroxyphenylpyruvate dioxygenase [Myxococcaceae bacterium GXIMD 01537]
MSATLNPLGLRGIAFIEFAHGEPESLATLLRELGFSKLHAHRAMAVDGWSQNDIHFLVNREPGTFADGFRRAHGPCVSALGMWVHDARAAYEEALRRGARAYQPDVGGKATLDRPAIHGIGDCLVYFVDGAKERLFDAEFVPHPTAERRPSKGFLRIDHLTNNIHKGTLSQWADHYKRIFGFTELRYFDIRGEQTGLHSFALQSPCGTFSIPINEGTESKSQIEEYLREYQGPGVQHIALLTEDLLGSLDSVKGQVPVLDIDPGYYDTVFERVPGVTESPERIRQHSVLVDGDPEGYLLQIFTRNLVGPIFFELIQRRNHRSFGEGNFGALFRSIERDQERRGVL